MSLFNRKRRTSQLLFINGPFAGKSIALRPDKPITIGRDRQIELPLDDEPLSRQHCTITSMNDQFFIEDLSSVNGTFVNGERLSRKIELQPFDRIFIGSIEMEFRETE